MLLYIPFIVANVHIVEPQDQVSKAIEAGDRNADRLPTPSDMPVARPAGC